MALPRPGWPEQSTVVGFSSGLPNSTEAVCATGAGTGGSSRLSFNFYFGVMFGTKYCHQKWYLTGGPITCFPMVESSFPRNPVLYKLRASGINFCPLEWTTHPVAIEPEVGQISADSMFPCTGQSWLHRNPLHCTCWGPGVHRLGGGQRLS